MSRFPSFKHAPSETRRILRDRFASKLHVTRQARFIDPELKVTPDQLVLRLLVGLDVFSNAEWSKAEAAYAAAGPTAAEPKTLESLADAGWLRRVWDRVKIPRNLRLVARRALPGAMAAFERLASGIYGKSYLASDAARSTPELTEIVEAIEAGRSDPTQIITQTAGWIAARLWESALQEAESAEAALRRWVDLWGLLQHPSIVPGAAWGADNAKAFRETAISVVFNETALRGWSETRELYVRQLALANNISTATAESRFPPAPDTLVGRALWTEHPMIEAMADDSLDVCADIFGLVRLLLDDVDAADHSPAPHPMAVQIIDLAINRAELFIDLLFQVRAKPRLLADLLLHPPSAALACLLIAQWRSPTGAWDRPLAERDFKVSQAEAFTDAAAILAEHLGAGRISAAEAAALLNWFHERSGPGYLDDVAGADLQLSAVRREIATCPPSVLLEMVASLDGPDLRRGLGTSEFATFLDLTSLGGIEDAVDAETVVNAYSKSVAAGEYSLSAHRVGVAAAAALARLAGRSDTLRARFLNPFQVRDRLAAAAPEDNEFTLADSIGRSIRTHIRILCRAIAGEPADVPADLFNALVAAVRAGALEHKEKGRVAAFAPRFEERITGPAPDQPLANDLIVALAAVDHARQGTLVRAILETDEPLILAQLLPKSPPSLRSEIEQRIDALAPTDAGAIRSLPEMQARINELLAAGAANAAASYMAAELDLKTWGKPSGRELVRFQNQLRLAFVRQDWSAIAATPDPAFAAPLERASAMETLRQFRGLAALIGPASNSDEATALFAELFAKRPAISFATNWFAAAISGLLQADSFGLLKGAQIRKGQEAIAEVDRMSAMLPSGSADEAMGCNRALLLLALGDPGQALAVLATVPIVRLQDTAAAYRAVALARLGRRAEATAALDEAEHTFGRTPILTAARGHIASGAPFLSVPDVSLHEDLVTNVASAIARFRNMNPTDQARVLQNRADPFEGLLVDYVRSAADAVVSLVPMMKGVQIDAIEDDLSAFFQQLLSARVHFLGWSVGDQSKGGFSGKGNAGERDLLITWGGSVLALIEAVVCSAPLTHDAMKADMESHFQKLLGYGNPRIFFHLTYAYTEDKAGLMRFLETTAETASPPGFTFRGREPIPHEDSRPPGFVARYDADFGEVKVVFLVLNLGQQRQRQAAQFAGATKSRKAPRKAKSNTK